MELELWGFEMKMLLTDDGERVLRFRAIGDSDVTEMVGALARAQFAYSAEAADEYNFPPED